MRIGFDAKRAFTNTSGLGNYSRFILSSLIQIYPENKYVLYTPRTNPIFRHFLGENEDAIIIQPEGWVKKLSSFWRIFGLTYRIKKDQLDIYHGLSNELPANISKSGVKAIVTIHDLIFLRYPELYKPIDRLIYTYKFKNACQQADRVVAISNQTKLDIVSYFNIAPDKVDVIYQDCNPAFHNPVTSEAKSLIRNKYNLPDKYLLSVGTHEPRKNQLNLLKAWHQAETDLDLVFIGKQTKYTDKLRQYIKQHQLQEKVHFLPYIIFEELPPIYQMAHIFAYPSTFEGFGIPILEAINSGVPVITSTGSCFREAGGDAACYVSPDADQVTKLADAIYQLNTNVDLRNKMINTGYQHALIFRPEQTIAQLSELYKRVFNS